jgi:hypothetical protein
MTTIRERATSADQSYPANDASVRVEGDRLVVDGYVTRRPGVVALFSDEAPDRRVQLLDSVLETGALAHGRASNQADLDRLGREVERIQMSLGASATAVQERLATEVQRGLEDLAKRVDGLVGEDGTLCQLLDPASPGGLAIGVADAVRHAASAERTRLAELLDPTSPTSPLRVLGENLRVVSDGLGQLRVDIAASKAADSARSEEAARGTARGAVFETDLLVALRQLGKVHADTVELVGSTPEGVSGSKRGDHLVTISGVDHGGDATFVVEAKSGKVGLTEMKRQLAQARERRGAAAGLGVWASEATMPTGTGPIVELSPVDVGVVFDPATGDGEALRLGYHLCRVLALAAARRSATNTIDAEALSADLAEARLKAASVLRLRAEVSRLGSGVAAGVEALRASLAAHGAELTAILERMETRLLDARPVDEPAGAPSTRPSAA